MAIVWLLMVPVLVVVILSLIRVGVKKVEKMLDKRNTE